MDENELRWQLRRLPHEIKPPRDLWPDIEARLARTPNAARAPRRSWLATLAIAACLCVAVGGAWMLRTSTSQPTAESLQAELVRREGTRRRTRSSAREMSARAP